MTYLTLFDGFRIRNGSWASFSISMQEYQYNSMMKYSTLVLIQFPIDHNSWAATTDAIIQAINIRDRIRYASGLFFHHISISPVRALLCKNNLIGLFCIFLGFEIVSLSTFDCSFFWFYYMLFFCDSNALYKPIGFDNKTCTLELAQNISKISIFIAKYISATK